KRFLGILETHKIFGTTTLSLFIGRVSGYPKHSIFGNRLLLGGTSFKLKILFCYATRVNGYGKYRERICSCCMLRVTPVFKIRGRIFSKTGRVDRLWSRLHTRTSG
ncbi:hypothetical protein GIB67_035974, partial [Kingdonia uniflora]